VERAPSGVTAGAAVEAGGNATGGVASAAGRQAASSAARSSQVIRIRERDIGDFITRT